MIQIFVEGIADVKFLTDYISHIILGSTVQKEGKVVLTNGDEVIINKVDGWKNLNSIINTLKENTDQGWTNLIIFDTDKLPDGGYEKRKEAIENDLNLLSFNLFLFPNNADDGALEELLEKIILDKNRPVFECWNGYERCLQSKTIEGRKKPLTTPAIKTKIYAYLSALLDNSKTKQVLAKERERNYKNLEHWNLNADYLNPLKDFLLQHLDTNNR